VILKLTSPKKWLPTLTLAWGIVATLLGVTQNMAGFFVARFFLGVTESGLFPGVVFYLSMWYKREEQHYRISLFFSAASLAGAFGGVLAWVSDDLEERRSEANRRLQGIAHMRDVGGLNGWRWIFILEGILTILVSLLAYFFIANYPSTAKFLTDKERASVHARLASNNDATRNEAFTWPNVRLALGDPKVWLYGLGFHTMSLPLYTLSLFLPTIIKELGYTAAQAQLLTVPPYAVAFVFTLSVAVASEKLKIRAPFIMGSASFAVIGYIILLSAKKPGVSYVGTIFAAAGIYPATAIVLSWPANNVSGQTKRATANAMQISIGNLGAVLGTQLYRSRDGPRFYVGHGFALGYLCANVIVVGSLWAVLRAENARRDRGERDDRLVGVSADEWLGDDDPRWRFQT
jgi:MFS family permease